MVKYIRRKFINKSNFTFKNNIRKSNPNIFHFNVDSNFIYEPRYCSYHYQKLNDFNKMKPDSKEIKLLVSLIDTLSISQKDNSVIYVKKMFADVMSNVFQVQPELNETALAIKEIILDNQNKGHVSIRKITELYNNHSNNNLKKAISKSKVHRIVKNILKFSYRKTIPKTVKLVNEETLKYSFFFIKIFLRALKLKLIPIFVDESGFTNENNNFYCWRLKGQEIHSKFDKIGKFNLIMGVTPNKIIHYEIRDEPTNSDSFLEFMEEMLKKIGSNNIKNHIIIMDNASIHLSMDMFKFYNDKKIKVLFGVPYMSPFNMIEFCFRFCKNIIYKNLYSNIKKMKEDLINILNNNDILMTMPKLYNETLNKYLLYINENKHKNLNN